MAERRPRNVADLGIAIRNNELIRQNKFAVEFVGSVLNQFDNGFKLKDATLQTESINFPGRNLATVERRSHGVVQEFPYEHQFSGDIEIVFKLLDFGNGITMRTIIEDWMILQDRSSYTCEMRLFGYSQGDDFLNYSAPPKMTGVATEVFPKTISAMQFSDTADSYQTLTVGFSFREFTQF